MSFLRTTSSSTNYIGFNSQQIANPKDKIIPQWLAIATNEKMIFQIKVAFLSQYFKSGINPLSLDNEGKFWLARSVKTSGISPAIMHIILGAVQNPSKFYRNDSNGTKVSLIQDWFSEYNSPGNEKNKTNQKWQKDFFDSAAVMIGHGIEFSSSLIEQIVKKSVGEINPFSNHKILNATAAFQTYKFGHKILSQSLEVFEETRKDAGDYFEVVKEHILNVFQIHFNKNPINPPNMLQSSLGAQPSTGSAGYVGPNENSISKLITEYAVDGRQLVANAFFGKLFLDLEEAPDALQQKKIKQSNADLAKSGQVSVDMKTLLFKRWMCVAVNLIDIRGSSAAFETHLKEHPEYIEEYALPFPHIKNTIFNVLACSGEPLEFVSILAKFNVNFANQNIEGDTPLMCAIVNAQNSMAMEILRCCPMIQRSYLDCQCPQGNTALHLAVAKGYKNISVDEQILTVSNLKLVEAMIAQKANPNLQNRKGNTPLHLAVIRRDPDMVAALLKGGANLFIENRNGETPIDCLNVSFEDAALRLQDTVYIFFVLDRHEFMSNKDMVASIIQDELSGKE